MRVQTAAISVAVLFAFAWQSRAVQGQEAPVQLELTPVTLELPRKGNAQSQLTLRNKSQSELHNVKLDWFTNTGAEINAGGQRELSSLAPQAETFWALRVSQGDNGLVPGHVYFRVSYSTRKGDTQAHLLTAALQLSSRQTDEAGKVAEVLTRTSSTLLNEQRPGQVFLVINNKINLPLRVAQIAASGPGFISIETDTSALQKNAEGAAIVGPHDSAYVPVRVKVTDAVTPGKHMLLFRVPIEWGAKGQEAKANLIAQQEFDVGILAESELLTALGLPSFLLLPGFLMIFTFRLLSRQGGDEESLLKAAANPALWVSAITLSGLMAFLYPFGMRLLGGVSRDYLYGYGLGDIVRVWLASILVGALAWALFQALKYIWRWLFMPSEDDEPEVLLRKLFWQRLNLSLYQFDVKLNDQDRMLFLLERKRDGQETFWVGPYIKVAWQENAPSEFKQRFEKRLQDGGAYRMAKLIAEGKQRSWLTADWWEPGGALTRPYLAKKAEVTRERGTKENIVRPE